MTKVARTNLSKFMLRLPAEVKGWLASEARRNASSQNSEIVRSIRERMERTGIEDAQAPPSSTKDSAA